MNVIRKIVLLLLCVLASSLLVVTPAQAKASCRTETVSSMLRDDYVALSMVAVAYTMLHTTALALRDQMTATMALQNLKHVTPLITEISKVIPILVAQDVHDDVETADVSVAQQAIRNTQEAWDAKNVNQMSSSNAYAMAN